MSLYLIIYTIDQFFSFVSYMYSFLYLNFISGGDMNEVLGGEITEKDDNAKSKSNSNFSFNYEPLSLLNCVLYRTEYFLY